MANTDLLQDKRQQVNVQQFVRSPWGADFDPRLFSGGFNVPIGTMNNLFSSPDRLLEWMRNTPGVAAMLQAEENAKKAAANFGVNLHDFSGQRAALGKQRAAAAALREIEKKRLQFQLDTGVRDIGQAREAGLQGAINNALQRGIFRSGIRLENEVEVNREADEAGSDLQTQIDLALQALKQQGIQQEAGFEGQLASMSASERQQRTAAAQARTLAQAQGGFFDAIAATATQRSFNTTDFGSPTTAAPVAVPPPVPPPAPTSPAINPADRKFFGIQ